MGGMKLGECASAYILPTDPTLYFFGAHLRQALRAGYMSPGGNKHKSLSHFYESY
jgi:hypothetical protein